ncbi:hypothetical protein ACFW1A_15405 [Kitasatospora sp. NPDC058965]|uniref:hypothetical protein n=1 Tax=Kitasatospora sp. NPDC058965 TaxID=3346682 RepID=UPI0036797C5D
MSIRRTMGVAVSAAALCGVAFGATPASANTNSLGIPGGDTLQATLNFGGITWSDCFDWNSSAYLAGSNPLKADSITNHTHFDTYGMWGHSITTLGQSGASVNVDQTFANSWASNLSSNACTSVTTTYTSGQTSATATVWGQVYSVSTSVG